MRLGDGGVAVDDCGGAAVFGGPVVADGQAEFVGFAGGVAVEGELAHAAGGAADVLFLEAGVGDDELSVVEDVMADEFVDEVGDATRGSSKSVWP